MDPKKMFFTAPDDGGAGGATPPAPSPAAQPPATELPKPELKYSDDDLNARAAAARKEAAEKLWKKHGFESEKAFEDYLTSKKADDEKSKSEAQKAIDAKAAAEAKAAEVEASAQAIRLENAALKAGVSPDKAERFVKLAAAYDGDDAAAKIAAALKDFPEFKGTATLPNVGGQSKNQPNDDLAAAKAAAAKAFGLKGTIA